MPNPFYLLDNGFEILSPMLQMEKSSYATLSNIHMVEPFLSHNKSPTLGQVRSFFYHCATQVELGELRDTFLLDARYRLSDWFESIVMGAAPYYKSDLTNEERLEFWYMRVDELRIQLEITLNKWAEEMRQGWCTYGERSPIKFVLLDMYDGENGPRSQLPFYKEIASNQDVWIMLAAALLSINELFFSYLKEPTPIGLRHETMIVLGQIPWYWIFKQSPLTQNSDKNAHNYYGAVAEQRTEFFEFIKKFSTSLPDSPIRALAVMANWGTEEEAALKSDGLNFHHNYYWSNSIRYSWPDNDPFPFSERSLEWYGFDHVIYDSYVSSCGYRSDVTDQYVERSITDNLLALFLMTPADAANSSFNDEAASDYVGGFYYGSSCYGGDNDYYREQARENGDDLPELGGDSNIVRSYFFQRGLARAKE